jgi:hypothetical protein
MSIKIGNYYIVVDHPQDVSLCDDSGRIVRAIRFNMHTQLKVYVGAIDGKGPFEKVCHAKRPKEPEEIICVHVGDLKPYLQNTSLKIGDKAKVCSIIRTTDGDIWTRGYHPSDTRVVTIVETDTGDAHGRGNVIVDWQGVRVVIDPWCLTLIASAPSNQPVDKSATPILTGYCSCNDPKLVRRYAGSWFDFCTICRNERK